MDTVVLAANGSPRCPSPAASRSLGQRQATRPALRWTASYPTHLPDPPTTMNTRPAVLSSIIRLVFALLLTGPSFAETASSGDLLVAAAADLKFALDEVIAGFGKTHPQVTVKATYGSSGNLFAQIIQGAPFDLFLSADASFPRKLIATGKGEESDFFLYGIGRIVVWVPKSSPIDVEKEGIRALLCSTVKKIAIANPEHAPYGRAAVAALKHFGVHDGVTNKLVLGENVAQTAQFVGSGAADIGVIALSLAVAPKLKATGRYWEVPANAHPQLEQGGVVLTGGKNAAAARALRVMLMGKEGRAVLARYGFVLPDK